MTTKTLVFQLLQSLAITLYIWVGSLCNITHLTSHDPLNHTLSLSQSMPYLLLCRSMKLWNAVHIMNSIGRMA